MSLALRGAAKEIVLVDKIPEKAFAQAYDIADMLTFPPNPTIVRAGDIQDCADANIVAVAIGQPRLPGQTRLDVLGDSARMLKELIAELEEIEIPGIVITITNPVDIIADGVRKGLNMDRKRAFGTGTMLDTARLIRIISEQSGVSRASIDAFSMGEHGDSSMVPFSQVRIASKAFERWQSLDKTAILNLTRKTGMDIIEGKGSTEFGIGQALSELCTSILSGDRRIFPLSVLLEGEYGQRGVHCGVPCIVGRDGIEEIVELPLTDEEQAQLNASCDVIRKYVTHVE
jgi:L-lactate dehydrogenase